MRTGYLFPIRVRWRSPVRRIVTVAFMAAVLVTLAAPTYAQKVRPATTEPDADSDGVPDRLDRCPGTPRGERVARDGCPVRLLAPGQQAPAVADSGRPGKARRPTPTLVAHPSPDTARGPAPARAAPVSAQAVPSAGRAAAFSAGLSIQPFGGEEPEREAYLRRFTTFLDSAVASLTAVFRNTSGQPMAGASSPTSLSQRERERWGRCRDLHWDLQSFVPAMHQLIEDENLPDNPTVQRSAAELDSALAAMSATVECDNLASMIAAPERWTPWESQYASSARRFYQEWYAQVREVAERNRAFVVALNGTLPADRRIPVPPAMPRTPPYAGATPR
jgi:hypothetical protein